MIAIGNLDGYPALWAGMPAVARLAHVVEQLRAGL